MRSISSTTRTGFAIHEMLVSACVLLVAASISAPMLGFNRTTSASHSAAANALAVARGIETLAADTGFYAPAFRTAPDGRITHHSALLLGGGYVTGESAFTSPLAPDGGAPKAGDHVDQADRTAFTVNGAIMPPEPLEHSGTDRHYRLVSHTAATPQSGPRLTPPSDPISPATTLLLTEWYAGENWGALAQGPTIMSHRPIVPFVGVSAGRSPEREPVAGAAADPFAYPHTSDILGDNANFRETLTSVGTTEINAMGRSHRGARAALIMLDGSARLVTPSRSVNDRLWGMAFHSITGGRGVR